MVKLKIKNKSHNSFLKKIAIPLSFLIIIGAVTGSFSYVIIDLREGENVTVVGYIREKENVSIVVQLVTEDGNKLHLTHCPKGYCLSSGAFPQAEVFYDSNGNGVLDVEDNLIAILNFTKYGNASVENIEGRYFVRIINIDESLTGYSVVYDDQIPKFNKINKIYIAEKAWFYSEFEEVGCNTNFTNCIFKTKKRWNATADSSVNSRDWEFDLVIDLDGDVEDMDINVELQNTGTGDATEDAVIKEAALYTYEDEPQLIMDLTPYIEDQTEIDANTGPLEGDEYVLHIVFHTKTISPDFAIGDDIARISINLNLNLFENEIIIKNL